jgi:hypothetical protein
MKRHDGPTAHILRMARQAPGGIIRWNEARDEYLKGSQTARDDEKSAASRHRRGFTSSSGGGRHYHMTLHQTLKRNFLKVEGTNGYYVLKTAAFPDVEDNQ